MTNGTAVWRLILRVGQVTLLALVATYVGDAIAVRYRIPGNRESLGSVQVQTLFAVRLKNGTFDYSLGDTATQTCAHSLFPQLGYQPCWYLNRHKTRRVEIGLAMPGIAQRAALSSGRRSRSIICRELDPKLVTNRV